MTSSPEKRFKIAYVDVDNTLFRYTPVFEIFLRKRHPKIKLNDSCCRGIYHDYETVFDGEPQEIAKMTIANFHRSPDYGTLEPYPDVQEVVPEMKKEGWRFVAVTVTYPNQKSVINRRKRNLRQVFGSKFFDEIHCLIWPQEKKDILSTYKPGIWVEDHPKHAKAGADAGHETYLLERTHNLCDDPRILRVNCWRELQRKLRSNPGQYIPITNGTSLIKER